MVNPFFPQPEVSALFEIITLTLAPRGAAEST